MEAIHPLPRAGRSSFAERATAGQNRANGIATSRYQPLVLLLLAVVVGIALDRFGRPNLAQLFDSKSDSAWTMSTWPITWWTLASLFSFFWWQLHKHKRAIGAEALLAAVSLTAAAWHDLRWQEF